MVKVVFQELLVFTRLRDIVSNKSITVNAKNVVISNIKIQMTCDIPVLL